MLIFSIRDFQNFVSQSVCLLSLCLVLTITWYTHLAKLLGQVAQSEARSPGIQTVTGFDPPVK